MRLLFLTEYFYPYIHGGGEISIQELAKSLSLHGKVVHVLTPNYGTVSFENYEGVKIHRYFFGKKLKNYFDQLSPSWYFNPIYFSILFVQIIKEVWSNKIQIIHIHGLFSLPSAILAGKILGVPVVVTFRDAQLLCNYGFCLTKNQFGHACNLKKYFLEDFAAYWQDKVQSKNVRTFIVQIIFALIGRVRTKIMQMFAKQANIMLVSSFAQQKTFAANGFKAKVIYNIYNFPEKFPASVPVGKIILYATKMSSGKGLDLLIKSLPQVLRTYPDVKLLAVGSGDKKYYEEMCHNLGVAQKVEILGRKDPEEVMNIRKNVLLEVCPSVYPESFGRTALEALANGVPAVVSNRGGLTDIVEDGKTGYITDPVVKELSEAIIKGIKNNKILRQNIRKEYANLSYKFSKKPTEDYLKLYKSLL